MTGLYYNYKQLERAMLYKERRESLVEVSYTHSRHGIGFRGTPDSW